MEISLENHLSCCRCCSTLLKAGQKTVKISKSIEKRFFELSGIRLIVCNAYSTVICESCNSKLSEYCDFREEICEYQKNLYEYVNTNTASEAVRETAEESINELQQDSHKEDLSQTKVEALEQTETFEEEPEQVEEVRFVIPINNYVDYEEEEKPKFEKFCHICNRYFPAKSYYNHKMRNHSVEEFSCDLDGKSFRLKNDLKDHMKIHISREERIKFFCKTCNAPFLSMTALRNHENYFHSDYIEEHPCWQCGKIFPSRMKILQHTKNVHREMSFVCTNCNKVYATPASLKKHLQKRHSKKQPCTICSKLFALGPSMNMHMKNHSTSQYKCTFEGCDKKFHTKTSFYNHLETHRQSEPAQCSECDSTFPSIRHLNRHQKRQHSYKAQCEVANCFHTSARKDYLVKHYKTHRELDDATREMLIARVKDMKDITW